MELQLTKDTNSIEQSSSQQLTSQLSVRTLFISLLTRIITRQRKAETAQKNPNWSVLLENIAVDQQGMAHILFSSADTEDGH